MVPVGKILKNLKLS